MVRGMSKSGDGTRASGRQSGGGKRRTHPAWKVTGMLADPREPTRECGYQGALDGNPVPKCESEYSDLVGDPMYFAERRTRHKS